MIMISRFKLRKTTALRLRTIATLILTFALAVGVVRVLAVHDLGIFELDGNSINNTAPGEDFDNIFLGTDSALVKKFMPFLAMPSGSL